MAASTLTPDDPHQAAPDTAVRNLAKLVALCVVIGLVAGVGAAIFFVMLEGGTSFFMGTLAGYEPTGAGYERPLSFLQFGRLFEGDSIVRWMLLILPAIGGLISGWIIFAFAPEAEGHGTDAAIEAYHFKDGAVRARVPLVKAITAMITIGSGGSGGREGPIAQIGSGFGSLLGRWLNVPPNERRVLMAAGMAAGIGAIFHAPLAGALFVAEVLYRDPDFEHEVLVPSFISSIVAYSVFGWLFGFHPLFKTPAYVFNQVGMLAPYCVLAAVSALGAMLYVRTFYGVRHIAFGPRFGKIPNHFKPAIGGLFVGMIGFCLPEALGAGYGVVQMCFNGNVAALPSFESIHHFLPDGLGFMTTPALLLLLIAVAKILTTALAIGSGGSGGVFGPAVVIGGALGSATGLVCERVLSASGWDIQPGSFALVGMAGFFAGAANTPVSTIIMVSEMTGNYNLLVPSMLVCIVSYILCRRFTLYEKQLVSRLDAPSKAGNMAGAILRRTTVGEAIAPHHADALVLIGGDVGFRELLKRYTTSSQACFPTVDAENLLTGVINAADIRRIITEEGVADLIIARDIERPATTIRPEDSLLAALNNLSKSGQPELVVVDKKDNRRVIATLGRGDIIAAYNRQIVSSA